MFSFYLSIGEMQISIYLIKYGQLCDCWHLPELSFVTRSSIPRMLISGILLIPLRGTGLLLTSSPISKETYEALCLIVFSFIQRVTGLKQIPLKSQCLLDHFPIAKLLYLFFLLAFRRRWEPPPAVVWACCHAPNAPYQLANILCRAAIMPT